MASKRTHLLIAAIAVLLVGCTSTTPRNEQGASGGGATGPAPRVLLSASKVVEYMDHQEIELRQRLACAQAISLRRESNNLSITLSSDQYFDSTSNGLTAAARQEILRIADVLHRYPLTRVRINAFTDNAGSESRNLTLTLQRVQAIQDAFVQFGIDPARIKARGFGESRPIRSNATELGRRLNRRVTVVIVPIRS